MAYYSSKVRSVELKASGLHATVPTYCMPVTCSGIHNSCVTQAIPGASDAIKTLKSRGLPILFVTNTTTKTAEAISRELQGFGIPCTKQDMITPASLAAQHIRSHNQGSTLIHSCTQHMIPSSQLDHNSQQHTDAGPAALYVAPGILPDFDGLDVLPDGSESGAAYVVLGDMGPQMDYSTLNRAFRLMMQPQQPQLLSLGKSRYFKGADGLNLDVGPFTAALEFATGCSAIILGKPSAQVFQMAADRLGVDASEVVMVGDDIVGDVQGAIAAGLKGVLVRTGKYRAGDELLEPRPAAVLGSIAELPGYLERLECAFR